LSKFEVSVTNGMWMLLRFRYAAEREPTQPCIETFDWRLFDAALRYSAARSKLRMPDL
jgi:hypothetical protein